MRVLHLCMKSCNPIRLQIGETSRTRTFLCPRFASLLYIHVHVYVLGLDSLSSRQDKAKLKWWHNLCTMKGDTYPRQLFDQVWEVKRRGKRVDDNIFEALLIVVGWYKKGNSSSTCKSFLACVDECVSERESKAVWKGLDIKTKLHMYKRFEAE